MANLTSLIQQTLMLPSYSKDVNEKALRKRVFDVMNENFLAENKTYDIGWTHSETGDRIKVNAENCERLNF
jgi:ABC-type sulfate transport system substrate-binding protein